MINCNTEKMIFVNRTDAAEILFGDVDAIFFRPPVPAL